MPLSIDDAKKKFKLHAQELRSQMSVEDWESGELFEEFKALYNSHELVETLYKPHKHLGQRIQNYKDWQAGNKDEDPGNLMEEIAALIFMGLSGFDSIQSYQSYSAEHDLVISGSSSNWLDLMDYLHLPRSGRTFVIEAKNISKKITDHQFSRLSSIVQNKFENLCHLGIFISSTNATGFGSNRVLRDARATQILFHAKTKKYIVVITASEFDELCKPGGLPRLLERKTRDVESAATIESDDITNWKEAALPKHIQKYLKTLPECDRTT